MIIDTHTHFYDPDRPEGVPWPAPDNELLYRRVLPDHFLAVSEPCGITGTVVVEASAWSDDNEWILDLAAQNPVIVGFVGHVDPGTPDFAARLRRLSSNPLFRGIRCGANYFRDVHAAGLIGDLEKLVEQDLELDVLVSKQHIAQLCQLARALPELRIVINHIAHVPIDGSDPDVEWVEAIQQAASMPGIFMKVSAVLEQSRVQPAPRDPGFYRPTLEALWQAFGEDRLIYGSNWPVCERASDYATAFGVVRDFFAEKGEVALEKYWWRNALAAYRYRERN